MKSKIARQWGPRLWWNALHDQFWTLTGYRAPPPRAGRVANPNLHPGGRIDADVCIVTNCMFPGGNAATTITELHTFEAAGMSVRIINCSITPSRRKWRWMSERYVPVQDRIIPAHHVHRLTCRTLIVRGPLMMMAPKFAQLARRITPEHAIFVVNNSAWKEDGTPIFSWSDLHQRISTLPWPSVELCPTGPIIRAESERDLERTEVRSVLSRRDWPPVLNERDFPFAPHKHWNTPIVIGRHARDDAGKWLNDSKDLLAVYPENDPNIQVRILGGAEIVRKLLGHVPEGWEVLPFGLDGVGKYLSSLDVFVNFPSPERHEAFGRTVVEAALSGLPVILPPRFEATFGDLGFYCRPDQVRGVIERLAADNDGRLVHLAACRDLAARLYCAPSLLMRLQDGGETERPRLTDEQRIWRAKVQPQLS